MNAAEVRALLGPPAPEAAERESPRLDGRCREFVAASPFFVLATAAADGRCAAAPKGGDPGFVTVLDEGRLSWVEQPGNRRADSLLNLVENPSAAVLFLVPGRDETLRVSGRVELSSEGGAFRAVLHVEQAYLYRAKPLERAGLWNSPRRSN